MGWSRSLENSANEVGWKLKGCYYFSRFCWCLQIHGSSVLLRKCNVHLHLSVDASVLQGYQDVRDRMIHRSTSQGSINSPVYSRHSYTPTMSRSPQHFHRPGKGNCITNTCKNILYFATQWCSEALVSLRSGSLGLNVVYFNVSFSTCFLVLYWHSLLH